MACRFEVLLAPSDTAAVDAARQALAEADRLEQAWSVFRADSALSAVNRQAASGACAIDDELFALLTRCRELSERTGGAFDITATPLSRCWRWLERDPHPPAPETLAAARARVGWRSIELRPPSPAAGEPARVGFGRPGMELNLGAIGKGYAVGRIALALRQVGVGEALVSAGDSSIEAVGAPRGGWEIALRDQGARLRLAAGAVATSGGAEQGIVVDGVRLGHVIDPRTGWPARGVARVTVVAPDAAEADALATAFLVGGPVLAETYLAGHDDVLAVFTLDGSPRPRIMGRAPGAAVEESS